METLIRKTIAGHEVTFDSKATLIRLTFKGRVTRDNLRACVEELYTDPDYNQNWNMLFDTESAEFDLSYIDLFQYVNRISKDPRRLLGAGALVSRSILHYGIGRMYDGIAGDKLGKFRIERSVEPALEWLEQQRILAASK